MKKIFLTLVFLTLFFAPGKIFAAEHIAGYSTEFRINTDSSVDVTERINYDFDGEQKHGIFRNIPVTYETGKGIYSLRVSEISVADENGRAYNFAQERSGDNLSIKIGDTNKLVTGQKKYVIKYKVKRALNYFDNQDEFYWNAIGTEWSIPIEGVESVVILPEGTKDIQADCFIGRYGSTERCDFEKNENRISFFGRDLENGEGMTLVVGFPKGVVTKPSALTRAGYFIADNWWLLLPVMVFVVMLMIWMSKGRDPKGRGVIITQFDAPDNLTPLEVGTIMDNNAEGKDLSAQIIYLAMAGYLKIKKISEGGFLTGPPQYEFEKLKDENDLANDFDKEMMKGIFGGEGVGKNVKMSDLKNDFYKEVKKIIKSCYKSLVEKGYFAKNPQTVRTIYLTIGLIILFGAIWILPSFGGVYAVVSFVISGVIVIIFSFVMPARTKKGALAFEHIRGFREYMRVAEKDRIEFHNAPEKNPEHFEKLLPYALALGVSERWAKQFEGIYVKEPEWYSGTTAGSFSAMDFTRDLGRFSAVAESSAFRSAASSGGSGFSGGGSGGGFGGGGGGSW